MTSQKRTLFQPTFVFPMVSVCVLMGAFLVYYFPITAQQEASLNRRAFRSLAAVSDSLGNRVVNYVDVLNQTSKKENGAPPQGSDLSVTGPAGVKDCHPEAVQVSTKLIAGSYLFELTCGHWIGTVAIDRMLTPYLHDTPGQLFDEIVLTDADGSVLYQSIATGSRIRSIRSAALASASVTGGDQKAAAAGPAGVTATPFAMASQSSTLLSTVIAGEEYKVYLVPVALKLPATNAASSYVVLAGLMRAKRFRADSMSVPGTALISAILLVLVAIVAAWPLLKFATMGATDRIPRSSAVSLLLTTLATIVLICILAIHLRYVVDLRDVDEKLTRLAASIENNLDEELKLALQVMDSANNSEMFARSVTPTPEKDCEKHLSSADKLAFHQGQLLARAGLRLSDYPYFDRMFWTDNHGFQHIKWEAASQTSPTYVGDRAYFVEAVANRLWQFAGANAASSRFRVDPVFSKNTGEYRAVISQRAPKARICGDVQLSVVSLVTPLISLIDPIMPPDYGFAMLDPSGNVLFHSTGTKNGQERFLDEVEDSGELGVALFARQGKLLTARYLGYDHRLFVTPLATLPDSPWSLIVFHNLSEGAAQHLERIVLFSMLTLTYYLFLAALLLAIPAARGPRAWMWPRECNRGSYLLLTLTVALITPPLYLLMFALSRPGSVLFVACVIPILTLLIAALKLKPVHAAIPTVGLCTLGLGFAMVVYLEPRSKLYLVMLFAGIVAALVLLSMKTMSDRLAAFRWPSLTSSYASLWASFLMIVSLLPCIGFFRIAYDYHGNLSTRRQQVQTMAALAEREERAKALYGGREMTLSSSDDKADVARWLFVRRRLEQTLDRYDTVFVSSDSGRIFSPSIAPKAVETDRARAAECDDGLPRYVQALASLEPYGKAALTRMLTEPASQGPAWNWCREGANGLRLRGRTPVADASSAALSLPPTRALFKSVTSAPTFLNAELVSELPVLNAWALPVTMIVFVATAFVTFLWVKPTIEQLFLLKITPTDALPELALDARTPLTEHLILLTFARAGTGDIVRRRQDVFFIDTADVIRGAAPDYTQIPQAVVVIDHFDYRNDDDEANGKKLDLLERLASLHPTKPVVIVTAVDPVFFFGSGSDLGDRPSLEALTPGQDMERWATALARFTRRRLTQVPSGSALERGRAVWSTCTTAERVALYQLAHDGWVNPRNEAALHHLQLRGLIRGMPFTFTDPGLEAFVSQSISGRDRKAWEQLDSASAWDGIRLMFVVLILGVAGAALFFSQQSVLGLVATGLGVLTPLTKLLSEANSFRSLLGFGKSGK